MRFRVATAERARRGARAALCARAAVLLVVAATLTWAPAASADVKLPPHPISIWPDSRVCNQSGFIVDTVEREFCALKLKCERLRPGDHNYAHWKSWCGVRQEAVVLDVCNGERSGFCGERSAELARRCPARPDLKAWLPEGWLCEQYYTAYPPAAEPPVEPPPPPPPSDEDAPLTPPRPTPGAPPTSTTPVAPPPTDGEAAPPAAGGSGTGTENGGGEDAPREDAEGRGEGESVPDVFGSLGARSPMCNRPSELGPVARAACRTSGSIVHAYPLSHYGLDVHVAAGADKRVYEMGVEQMVTTGLASAVQHSGGLVWMLLLLVLKGVLLLLEWSFEIPLIVGCRDAANPGGCASAMPQVAEGLREMHESVLGRGWLMAAFAAAGAWGIWNGMVRRRVSETFGGLAATVALMVAGIVIVYNPFATVGEVARISNDAALGVLSVPSAFERDADAEGFAGAQANLFDTLVKRPWCALQFGDLEYCLSSAVEGEPAVADVWLSFDSGSRDREELFKMLKGERGDSSWGAKAVDALTAFGYKVFGDGDDPWGDNDQGKALRAELRKSIGEKAPEKVHLQQAGGTPQRVTLLALVIVAQIGATIVLLWIAIRLVMASVMALILLLLVPVVLLCASLGSAGRRMCLTYALRLLATVIARFAFAFILMVILVVSGTVASLTIGWFAVWLLQIAFWYGLIFQRGRLLSFARLDPAAATSAAPARSGAGPGLMQLAYSYQGLRQMGGELASTVSSPLRMLRESRGLRDEIAGATVRDGVGLRLKQAARNAMLHRRIADRQRAEQLAGKKTMLQRKAAAAGRQRKVHQALLTAADPNARVQALRRKRDEIKARRAARQDGMAKRERRLRELDGRHAKLLQRRDAASTSGPGQIRRGHEEYRAQLGRKQKALADQKRFAEFDLKDAPRLRASYEQGRQAALDGKHPQLADTYGRKLAELDSREAAARATIASADPELAYYAREIERTERKLAEDETSDSAKELKAVDAELPRVEAEREAARAEWEAARAADAVDERALAANAVELQQAEADAKREPTAEERERAAAAAAALARAEREEAHVIDKLSAPELLGAEAALAKEDAGEPTDGELEQWIAARRDAVAQDADPVGREQLEAIGRTKAEYVLASPVERERLRRASIAAMEEHRRMFQIEDGEGVGRDEARAAVREARRSNPRRYAQDYERNAAEARERRRVERDLKRRGG